MTRLGQAVNAMLLGLWVVGLTVGGVHAGGSEVSILVSNENRATETDVIETTLEAVGLSETDSTRIQGLMGRFVFRSQENVTDTSECLIPPEGLVSWWSGNAKAAIDDQGDNDGVSQGDASFTVGRVGLGFQFDGDGDFVEAPDASLPSGRESRTIEFWIQTSESRQRAILGYGTGDTTQAGLAFRLELREGRVIVTQIGDAIQSQAFINDGDFHHVAIVVEGETETVMIYIDGVLDQTARHRLNTRLSGRLIIGADDQSQNSITAVVDELSVYRRVLLAAEIEAIFMAGSAGKCKTVKGAVSGVSLALIQCHNVTTGLSVVIPATEGASQWDCADSGLLINPGDWIHQELIGTAN